MQLMVEQSASLLLLLVGLPACGKSSVAQALAKTTDARVVSIDQIVASMQAHADPVQAWHQARIDALSQTKELLQTGTRMVIVDDNFELRSMRKPYFRFSQSSKIRYLEVGIPCTVETAIANNALRQEASVSEETIRNIAIRIEYPKVVLEVDTQAFHGDQAYHSQVMSRIKDMIASSTVPEPVPEQSAEEAELARKALENERYMKDQALRKAMGLVLQNSATLRQKAKQISEIKKEVLEHAGSIDELVLLFQSRVKEELT